MNPFLYLPPEIAHAATIKLLKTGLVPKAQPDPPELCVEILGKKFSNPIGLSAGADKGAQALGGWQQLGFGFVEAGTVLPRTNTGNPKPRIWRYRNRQSIINWLGMPSLGPEPFLQNLEIFKENRRRNLIVGVSIAAPGSGPEELGKLAGQCAPLADYLTLNISCPNLAHEVTTMAKSMAGQVRAAVSQSGSCPVLVKLGPTDDKKILGILVQEALAAGAAGFVATNTVPPDKKKLLENTSISWPKREGTEVGGYSGPGLLPVSTWMVSNIREIAGPDVPIIGVGGIQSGEDACQMLQAGANLIQIYTGFIYKGPALIRDMKKCLLKKH